MRYRVLTEQGAVYGDFSDYHLAVGQAEHMASPQRRHPQTVTVQFCAKQAEGWQELLVYVAGTTAQPGNAEVGSRLRLSALAA